MPVRCRDGRGGLPSGGGLPPGEDPPPPGGGGSLLVQLTPTGAGATTAGWDNLPPGVQSSYDMAQMDVAANRQFTDRFIVAATELNLPPALLAAISSRETRAGTGLDSNGEGDSGNAVGIMQIDKRWYTPADIGPDFGSLAHIKQAAGILNGYINESKDANPLWSAAQHLQAGTAAYNNGPEVFGHPFSEIDVNTDGGDYSNDVIARAKYYENNWSLLT